MESSVSVYENLAAYLRSFGDEGLPPLDCKMIAALIDQSLERYDLNELANKQKFSLERLKDWSIEPFITERRDVLAIEFKLSYDILNVTETQAIAATDAGPQLIELDEPITHSEAILDVSGNCFFDESKRRFRPSPW